jgi:hypothetical protein
MKKYWKIGVIVLGSLLGYGYYHFIGCRSGMCPLTSNPWISTGYGALIGFVFTLGQTKKNNEKNQGEEK